MICYEWGLPNDYEFLGTKYINHVRFLQPITDLNRTTYRGVYQVPLTINMHIDLQQSCILMDDNRISLQINIRPLSDCARSIPREYHMMKRSCSRNAKACGCREHRNCKLLGLTDFRQNTKP